MAQTTPTYERLREAAMARVSRERESDPIPAIIAEYAAKRVGKPITKRDVAAIEGSTQGLRVRIDRDGVGASASICYWVDVTLISAEDLRRDRVSLGPQWAQSTLPDGSVVASKGWTGVHKPRPVTPLEVAAGVTFGGSDPVYDRDLAEAQVALYLRGVPRPGESRAIRVRNPYWDTRSSSATDNLLRWPTVDELRAWNPWCYSARDEREVERDASEAWLGSEAAPSTIRPIAQLVDALNLMATEMRAYLDGVPEEFRRAVLDALEVDLERR